jgi:hypothetical protein
MRQYLIFGALFVGIGFVLLLSSSSYDMNTQVHRITTSYTYSVNIGASSVVDEIKWCDHVRELGFSIDVLNTSASQMSSWRRDTPWFVERLYDESCALNSACKHGNEGEIFYDTNTNHVRFDVLPPVVGQCSNHLDSFGAGDEEKRVYNLKSGSVTNECFVISIGSNGMWGFERDIFERTNCRIETFDCTGVWEVPVELRKRVTLHKICIGPTDIVIGDEKFMQWDSILNYLQLKSAPHYLKMDIEGFEYSVLRNVIDSGHHMPRQIAMEIHYRTSNTPLLSWSQRGKSSAELAMFMMWLWDYGGYALIDRRDNLFCAHCSEILLMKMKC